MSMFSTSPALRRLLLASIAARAPEAMLSVGLIVHVQRLTGSFGLAGAVAAAYGIALGVGGPVLGRLVDRRGQTVVLLSSVWVCGAMLAAIALLRPGVAAIVPLALAIGVGLATPPVGACLRAQLPSLLPGAEEVERAYTFETSILELTWVGGPPLVLGLGALWSTGGALAAAALFLVIFTVCFALQPSSRHWQPAVRERHRSGASLLRAPAIRTLTLVLLGVGVLLGADEIAVTAAARALDGTTAAAGPLLGLWAAGSFIGGLLVSRFGSARATVAGLALWTVALAIAHLALIGAAGSLGALAVMLPLAGAAVAPTESFAYRMVDAAAPEGMVTEAFSWLLTAMAMGGAMGAAGAGVLVGPFGPAAAFIFGGGACALAALVAGLSVPRHAARHQKPQLDTRQEAR